MTTSHAKQQTATLFTAHLPNLAPALVVAVVSITYLLLILWFNQWDPLTFVRLGTRYGQGDPNGTIGYDGQFAYQMALRPLGATPYLDIPPYRYQRMLYPLTARLAAFGLPQLIPWALLGLNLTALAVGTFIMSQLLMWHKLNPWYALPVGLFAGQLVSLRLDLNEPFALTFALLAVYAFAKDRSRWGAVFLALSMLSKETSIAFVGGYLLYFFLKRQWRRLIETGLMSLGPFALVQLVIWLNFGEIGVRSGGQGATSFSWIPFGGMFAVGFDNLQTLVVVLLILGPLILLPCLALTVNLVRFFRQGHLSPLALVLGLHIVMLATLPFSTYVDFPGVLRLTSGLVVAALAYAASVRAPKILNYAMLWLASIPLLIFIG
ncbi:MAG: hypothetical protein H6632_02150 [Anaerolineales bacterium]|nr:hypothetical protein [Anaerolineales bacterium]